MWKKLKRAFREWWECRTKQCDYYRHYLAYGPADLTHIGYHSAGRIASAHFANCTYKGSGMCRVCTIWEQRLRA